MGYLLWAIPTTDPEDTQLIPIPMAMGVGTCRCGCGLAFGDPGFTQAIP